MAFVRSTLYQLFQSRYHVYNQIYFCSYLCDLLFKFQPKCHFFDSILQILMTDSSDSSPPKRREHSRSPQKPSGKLFITNLDGKADIQEIENQLKKLFQKYGQVASIVAKRNRNSEYCFAFVDMKERGSAEECVRAYDQSSFNGKPIKVEFQDDSKRRKDSSKGCYNCGKMGHFARECNSARPDNNGRGHRRRSRSRSAGSDRHKKSKRRHRSDSSDRGRSRSPKAKKDRKNRSRDRDEKRKKKRRHSSSDS